MIDGSSDAARHPEGRSVQSGGWPSNRLLFVLFWAFAALLSETPVLLVDAFNDDAGALNGEMVSTDWRFWYFTINAIVFAPLIETALIAISVVWLRHHGVRDWILIGIAAGLGAALHQAFASQALLVLLPFLVFAYVFVKRSKPPHQDGFRMAALTHSLFNLVITGLMLYRSLSDS